MRTKKAYVAINGGLGKNIAFSQLTKEIKETYDFLAVTSPYYDVFEACPYVDYVYKPNEMKDFISDAKHNNAEIFIDRIYDTSDFIYKKVSYADAYRKMLHLKPKHNKNGSDTKTELEPIKKYNFINDQLKDIIAQIKTNGFEDFIIVQFEGGQSPLELPPPDANGQPDWSKKPTNYDNEPLKRHYPYEKAQQFINIFRETHPRTAVIVYQLPNEHRYEGVFQFTVPYLTYYELSKFPECKGTVSIDSSLQHLVAGNTKSVVIWGHSLPRSFGYEYNHNIIQKCNREDILYFSALGPSGARIDYIDPEELVKEVTEYCFVH